MRFYLLNRDDGSPVAAFLTATQRTRSMMAAPDGPALALVTVDAAPWPATGDTESHGVTPERMTSSAMVRLDSHGHGWRFESSEDRRDAREHCSACALAGYGMTDTELRTSGPDYAGWPRVYVQAVRPIPVGWTAPFWRELAGAGRIAPDGFVGDVNTCYGAALRRDVATFGLRFATPDGVVVSGRDVVR
jgi:hypothetical protein